VLYTCLTDRRATPRFIEAASLEEAERKLAPLRSDQIRFWSHPFFGDAPGADAYDALRRVAKPSKAQTWLVLAAAWATTPGAVCAQILFVADLFGRDWDVPVLTHALSTLAFLAQLFVAMPAFKRLRVETNERSLGLAWVLLWLLRLGFIPLAPIFTRWAVRIATGRTDVERAMRPYSWLRAVGLGSAYAWLREAALAQVNDHDARIAGMRTVLERGPNVMVAGDLGFALALYRRDVAGARAALASSGDGGRPLVQVWHRMVHSVIAAEAGDAVAALDIVGVRSAFAAVAPTVVDDLTPILDALTARALAMNDRIDAAVAALERAMPRLLAGADTVPLDRAAEAIEAARRRVHGLQDAVGAP
jgi:hypothetical protein